MTMMPVVKILDWGLRPNHARQRECPFYFDLIFMGYGFAARLQHCTSPFRSVDDLMITTSVW